jgi:hypothetical protein
MNVCVWLLFINRLCYAVMYRVIRAVTRDCVRIAIGMPIAVYVYYDITTFKL